MVPLAAGFLVMGMASLPNSDITYQSVVRRYCGKAMAAFCSLMVFLNEFGGCIVFLVTLADQIDQGMVEKIYTLAFIVKHVDSMRIVSI